MIIIKRKVDECPNCHATICPSCTNRRCPYCYHVLEPKNKKSDKESEEKVSA